MVKPVTLQRKNVQCYFIKIDFENIYAENVENEETVKL